jgi:hypothetical protein
MTSDTAALESPRCSARFFKLTPEVAGVLREDCVPADFDLAMGLCSAVWHKKMKQATRRRPTLDKRYAPSISFERN